MNSNQNIEIYSFFNNKGGVGKTTLCQNSACIYAKDHPDELVLVIDLCPQANVSQFLLGGGKIGYDANQRMQNQSTRRNIVGFMDWLLRGNSKFTSLQNNSYTIQVSKYNKYISDNIYLIAGDSFLESQTLALNFATMNPANTEAWKEIVTAIRRLCELELASQSKFHSMKVFIDCNPSFSIYTQMALVSSDYLIIPTMADFSSLEGIKGILMLLYAKYPSAAVKNYATTVLTFDKQIRNFNLKLPKIHSFIFNNFTSNVGIANAYQSLKDEIVNFCWEQFQFDPSIFDVKNLVAKDKTSFEKYYFSEVKDFHSAGKVSATLGIPFYRLPEKSTYYMPDRQKVICEKPRYSESLKHLNDFVSKI